MLARGIVAFSMALLMLSTFSQADEKNKKAQKAEKEVMKKIERVLEDYEDELGAAKTKQIMAAVKASMKGHNMAQMLGKSNFMRLVMPDQAKNREFFFAPMEDGGEARLLGIANHLSPKKTKRIGVKLSAEGDDVKIESVVDGSPAEKAGIQSGDVILSVDGEEVDVKSLSDLVKNSDGAIDIVVYRDGEEVEVEVTPKVEVIVREFSGELPLANRLEVIGKAKAEAAEAVKQIFEESPQQRFEWQVENAEMRKSPKREIDHLKAMIEKLEKKVDKLAKDRD